MAARFQQFQQLSKKRGAEHGVPLFFYANYKTGYSATFSCARSGQVSLSEHSQQVEKPLARTHLRISHICSQNTVFNPSIRHPSQLIHSGLISKLFNALHFLATTARRASSFSKVALRASHLPQSRPQHPISLSMINYFSRRQRIHLRHLFYFLILATQYRMAVDEKICVVSLLLNQVSK